MKQLYWQALTFILLAGACSSPAPGTATENPAALVVQPAPLAASTVAGYRFPEDSTTIEGWVQRHDSLAIYRHGWGLWAALMAPVVPTRGDTMRVYQTWKTKQELAQDLLTQPTGANAQLLATQARPLLRTLEPPRQFFHDPHQRQLMRRPRQPAAGPQRAGTGAVDTVNTVVDVVSYNTVAAQTILSRQLFRRDALLSELNKGRANIHRFPRQAVVIKPIYEIVPGPGRSRALYQLRVWADVPTFEPPQGYGPEQWPTVVFVDVRNRGRGTGQVGRQGQQPTAAVTYNVRDFVHYTLNRAEAAALDTANAQNGNPLLGAQAGDIAILVGMHITTSEITQWTWQTFWWTPDPARAPLPSTAGIVRARPTQLTGAPAHYAMSIGYQMIDPAQPLTGGSNKGKSVYVYNPYLEAGFTPGSFDELAWVNTNCMLVVNNVGMRSNCMSCHAQANFNPADTLANGHTKPGYLGDTYVDYNDPKFKGVLKTDFLYSVPDMAKQLYLANKKAGAKKPGR
jgi:hypothetical protein